MRVAANCIVALSILVYVGTGCARTQPTWYETIARTTPPAPAGEDPADRLHWDAVPDRQQAMRILLQTTNFADIAIGGEGVTSAQVKSFGVLLDQPDAPRIFRVLLGHADAAAGQMYALCGLYLVDRSYFEKVVGAFRSDRRRLYTQYGCGATPTTVAELVQRRGPAIRIPPGHEADPGFYNDFGGNTRYIDIAGGGWPEIFRTAVARMDNKGDIHSPESDAPYLVQPGQSLFGDGGDGDEMSSEAE